MSPRDHTVSTRRRPSLSLRSRPRTAAHPIPISKDYTFDQWREASPAEACQDHNGSAVEDMEHFPEAVPRRRSAKSFSSLRHPMDGLVALGRRLSVTIRSKSSKHNMRAAGEGEKEEEADDDGHRHYHHVGNSYPRRNATSGHWNARARAWSHGCTINRHHSLNSATAIPSFYAPIASVPAPIPGRGSEPPILPDDKYAGAAARAAAAAQNERMEMIKTEMARAEREKSSDLRLTQDSESGIGIDLRDRSDISDTELDIMRIGTAELCSLLDESRRH